MPKNKIITYALIAVLLAATLLRVWGINHTAWTDEDKAVNPSINMVDGGKFPLFSIPESRYPHLSHYAFGLAFWPLSLIQAEPDSGPYFIIARVVVALFSVATVFIVFLIGSKLVNQRTGLIAAVLATVAPLSAKYSHYAHVEMPGIFVMSLALLAAVYLWQTGRPKYYFLTGLLAGAAAGSQFWALSIGIVLPLAHLKHISFKPFKLNSFISKHFLLGLILVPVGFLIVSPWSVIQYEKNFASYQQLSLRGAAGDMGHTRPHVLWPLYTQSPDWSVSFTKAGVLWEFGWLASLLALAGALIAIKEKNWQVASLLVVSTIIIFLAISGSLRLYAVKRLLPMMPLFALLAAYAVNKIMGRRQLLGLGLLVVALTINTVDILKFNFAYAGGSTHEQAVAWAEEHIPHDSTMLQHGPLRLFDPSGERWNVVRLNEIYASFNKEDPEAAHDRARPIEQWIKEDGVEFIAMDSRLVDRYYDPTTIKLYPETTASYQNFYDDIRERGKLLYKIGPEPWKQAGPRVEIYDLRKI